MNMRRKNRRWSGGQIASVSMISLTDVLLTLLIFFMFIEISQNSGAFMLYGKSGSSAPSDEQSKVVRVNYTENGEIYVVTPSGEKTRVERAKFRYYIKLARERHSPDRLLINAHKSANYKEVISIMDDARSAGYENISLVDSRL
jgi:biopolymer transport protein ExbD